MMKNILNNFWLVSVLTVLISCNETRETTFYLVRHAEKQESHEMQDQNEDPPLIFVGEQRAERLNDKIFKVVYSQDTTLVTVLHY